MRSVNTVILIGNTTRDAGLRQTQTGKPVANIRLATNRIVNGAEQSQFHTIVCWDTLAEAVSRYVKKGEPRSVEGRLEYRTVQDGDSIERGVVEIIASDVQFLGRPGTRLGSSADAQGDARPDPTSTIE